MLIQTDNAAVGGSGAIIAVDEPALHGVVVETGLGHFALRVDFYVQGVVAWNLHYFEGQFHDNKTYQIPHPSYLSTGSRYRICTCRRRSARCLDHRSWRKSISSRVRYHIRYLRGRNWLCGLRRFFARPRRLRRTERVGIRSYRIFWNGSVGFRIILVLSHLIRKNVLTDANTSIL